MGTQGSSRITESDRGPEPGEAYGIAGLTQQLHGIDFPISKDQLMQQYGKKTFQWTKGGETLSLENCLKNVQKNEFNAITEITAAVSDTVKQPTKR
jgi:hypothetical protein